MTDISAVRVGVLACEGYCPHTKPIWGPIMEQGQMHGATGAPSRFLPMSIARVWDVDRQAAEELAGQCVSARVVDGYADMVGEVDGVILDDFNSCQHFAELARPYLEAGTPMFINRPFAMSLADAHEIIDLARRHDAPLICASTFEFAPEVGSIQQRVATCAPIAGYAVANSMSDYATHGVHGLMFAHACVGGGVRSVAYQTPDWHEPNGVVTIEHEPRDGGKVFYGSIQEVSGTWGWIRVFGGAGFEQSISAGPYFWLPLLLEIQRMFQTRQMPQPYEAILEKTQIFLAGFKSHLECDGAPVALTDIGDFVAPRLHPDPYPEGFFRPRTCQQNPTSS